MNEVHEGSDMLLFLICCPIGQLITTKHHKSPYGACSASGVGYGIIIKISLRWLKMFRSRNEVVERVENLVGNLPYSTLPHPICHVNLYMLYNLYNTRLGVFPGRWQGIPIPIYLFIITHHVIFKQMYTHVSRCYKLYKLYMLYNIYSIL